MGAHRLLGSAVLVAAVALGGAAAPAGAATSSSDPPGDPADVGGAERSPIGRGAGPQPSDLIDHSPPSPREVVAEVGRREEVDVVRLSFGRGGPVVESVAAVGRRAAKQEVLAALGQPSVVAVEVDSRVHSLGAADPRAAEQWGNAMLNASEAWGTSTGAGAVVAVLDSGVDGTHPDLAGALLPGINTRLNRGDQTPATSDANGHGTHVAGVIAARAGNGVGGAGVAPEASVLPVKVLDRYGGGWESDVTEGIIWAVDNGADVINLSLGGEESELIGSAVGYALSAGVVVVAAAGNDATDKANYPAAVPGVLSVTAIASDGRPAGYANYGATVDLHAPGDRILSTIPGGYAALSGTSMAAPFVAGAAALVRSAQPGADVAAVLLRTARPNPAAAGFGAGLVDPLAALGVGCAAACPPVLPAADAAAWDATEPAMQQNITPPARARALKRKLLPAFSNEGVPVRRWKSRSKSRCVIRRDRIDGEWWLKAKRRGICRLKVAVPAAEGLDRLRERVRVRIVGRN